MVGGKMVRITRQNCETPENLSADVPQEIQDAIELFRNPEYIGSLIKEKVEMAREQCGLSKVQSMFLYKLNQLPDLNSWEIRAKEWDKRLGQVDDLKLSSLVVELLQNSMDIDAKEIRIAFTENEGLHFSHDGKEWSVDELAAVDNFVSTKQGNISTIGQFGVGLKYWWHHFKQFTIVYHEKNVIHRLVLERPFMPNRCYYEFHTVQENPNEGKTEFQLERLIYGEDSDDPKRVLFNRFQSGQEHILTNRMLQSMPNLLGRGNESFEIQVGTTGGDDTSRIELNAEISFQPIDDVIYPFKYVVTGNDHRSEPLSFVVSLDGFQQRLSNDNQNSFSTQYTSFMNCVKDHFIQEGLNDYKKANEDSVLDDEQLIERALAEMTEHLEIRFHYEYTTAESDDAKPSQMFVASNQGSWSSAFSIDAPWKLTTDRLQLDFSNDGAANVKPRKWNTALSGVIEFIYVRIIRAVFEHPDHFGLSLSELHRILHGHQVFRLNRPGSDWSDYSAGDVHRNKMKLELGDMYSGTLNPSDRLVQLWKHVIEHGELEDQLWLSNAIDENITMITLENGVKIPYNNDGGTEYPIEEQSELCNQYGGGIPTIVLEWVNEHPEEGTMIARIGREINDQNIGFIPHNGLVYSPGDDLNQNQYFIELNRLMHLADPAGENNHSATVFEIREEGIDFGTEIERPELDNTSPSEQIKILELSAFELSLIPHDPAPEVFEQLLNHIQARPKKLEDEYIITRIGNHCYFLQIPSANHVLGLLKGDNNCAIPYSIRVREDAIPQVHLEKPLRYIRWGEPIDELPFAFVYDERYDDWWGDLFHPVVDMDGEGDNFERATFGVDNLDGTGVDLEGGYFSCNTGFEDAELVELHKRLRPFLIESLTPIAPIGINQTLPDLPEYALLGGLRTRQGGNAIQTGFRFSELPHQIIAVQRQFSGIVEDTLDFKMKKLALGIEDNQANARGEYYLRPAQNDRGNVLTSNNQIAPWALVLVTGPVRLLELQMEQLNTASERVAFRRLWRRYMAEINPPTGAQNNSDRFCRAYDVVFGGDGGTTAYRLHSRRISHAPPGESPQLNLNDDNTPRLLTSPIFEEFRDKRHQPFYRSQIRLDNLGTVLNLDAPTLFPIPDDFNLPDNVDLELIELNDEEIAEINQLGSNPFEGQIDNFFTNLRNLQPEDQLVWLGLLASTYSRGLIRDVNWNRVVVGNTNRVYCRNLMQDLDVDDFDEQFVEFLDGAGDDHALLWNQFSRTNVYYNHQQADLLENYGGLQMRRIDFANTYGVQYGPVELHMLFGENDIQYILEKDYQWLEAHDKDGHLLRCASENMLILDSNLVERLHDLGAQIQHYDVRDFIISTRDLEAYDAIDLPVNLAYVGQMVPRYFEGYVVEYVQSALGNFDQAFQFGPSGVKILIGEGLENRTIRLISNDDVHWSIEQHIFVMEALYKKMNQFNPAPRLNVVQYEHPWDWFTGANNQEVEDGKMNFAQRYCRITSLEQLHPGGYGGDVFENLHQVEHHLDHLIGLYSNKEPLLNNTISHARERYRGLHTIRTTAALPATHEHEQQLNRPVSIPRWMLGVQDPIGQHALGDTLYVSEMEVMSFRRFADHHPHQPAYDFHPDAKDIIRNRLFAEGNAGWFGGQELDELFTFEGIFISSSGNPENGCLWKVHALHILAYLTAKYLQGGN